MRCISLIVGFALIFAAVNCEDDASKGVSESNFDFCSFRHIYFNKFIKFSFIFIAYTWSDSKYVWAWTKSSWPSSTTPPTSSWWSLSATPPTPPPTTLSPSSPTSPPTSLSSPSWRPSWRPSLIVGNVIQRKQCT